MIIFYVLTVLLDYNLIKGNNNILKLIMSHIVSDLAPLIDWAVIDHDRQSNGAGKEKGGHISKYIYIHDLTFRFSEF